MPEDRIETLNNNYETNELELASFLKARGCHLVNAVIDGDLVQFIFEPAAAAEVQKYVAGAEVQARELFAAHRNLRALIRGIKNNNHRNGERVWRTQMAG